MLIANVVLATKVGIAVGNTGSGIDQIGDTRRADVLTDIPVEAKIMHRLYTERLVLVDRTTGEPAYLGNSSLTRVGVCDFDVEACVEPMIKVRAQVHTGARAETNGTAEEASASSSDADARRANTRRPDVGAGHVLKASSDARADVAIEAIAVDRWVDRWVDDRWVDLWVGIAIGNRRGWRPTHRLRRLK